jgi:hypothetical protein
MGIIELKISMEAVNIDKTCLLAYMIEHDLVLVSRASNNLLLNVLKMLLGIACQVANL